MCVIAIMGNGPVDHLPNLKQYENEIDVWIGVDRGALTLLENDITVDYAVGDFDSITTKQKEMIIENMMNVVTYSSEKDETDLEIALQKALELKPEKIYLFGVTGGRLDHALINIQLLLPLVTEEKIHGVIVDKSNQLELLTPGTYTLHKDEQYPYISFVPFTQYVKNLSLTGFYYGLTNYDLSWGSTRCISNELMSKEATFSFKSGKVLLIKSCDTDLETRP